jgi:hypothetical protein
MTVRVKCVICGHRWDMAPRPEMPACPKCMGPVTVIRVKDRAALADKRDIVK